MPIECFDKHYPRAKQQFTDRIKDGMSELEQRQEGLKIAEELQKQLNDEVNAFKEKIGKDPKEYKSTDKSAKVEGIKSDFDNKIQKLSEPKKVEGKKESTPEKEGEKSGDTAEKIVPPTIDEEKQQIEDFGVAKDKVEPVHSLLSQVFKGLKKAGLTTAKTLGDWVGIGKGKKENAALFQPTYYGESGIVKKPSFDEKSADKAIKSGRVKIASPKDSLKGLKFSINRPDDLFVGDIYHNDKKIGSFDGGVFYPLNGGENGKMWASVSQGSASGFSNQANRSLLINNGITLPKGFDGETLTYKKGEGKNEWIAVNKSGKEFAFTLPENPNPGVIILSKGGSLKHSTSLSGKVGLVKTLLAYGEGKEGYDGLIDAIKSIYNIGNTRKADKVMELFDNYLTGGRMADGQTMNEAKTSYDNFRAALISKANPLITKMLRDMGYDGEEYFNGTQLKKGIYKAKGEGIDALFKDLGQEDFLKEVNSDHAYAALKITSPTMFEEDISHPSYPYAIKTVDGSAVGLDIFNKTFNTTGENIGDEQNVGRSISKAAPQVTTTLPKYTLSDKVDLNHPESTDLSGVLNKYESVQRWNEQNKKPLYKKEENSVSPIDFSKELEKKYGIDLDLTGDLNKDGDLTLSRIVVPKDKQGTGVGTDVMSDIVRYAYENGKRIVLTPSTDFGGTSVNRLKDFYKKFGFVENKGRNKDYAISESMYLEPKEPVFKKAESKEDFGGFQTRDGKPIGFNYDTDKVARERFNFSKLKKIGSGSDRDVYDLGNGQVLKVAKTARGLTQNIYEGDYYLKGIIPEVFERGLNYVVTEKADSPAKNNKEVYQEHIYKEFEKNGYTIGEQGGMLYIENTATQEGVGFEELPRNLQKLGKDYGNLIGDSDYKGRNIDYSEVMKKIQQNNTDNVHIDDMLDELKKFNQTDFDNHNSKLQDVLEKYGLVDIMSYDVLWGDFVAKRNWGIKDGKPIHVDGGTFGGVSMISSHRGKSNMSDPEFRKIYEDSRNIKKKFGDSDKNTMYSKDNGEIQAQYRIDSGKNIVEAIQNFDGSPKAVAAITHEIMHPTVVAILDGAKEGNEVGVKHAQTIAEEFNKANPNTPVTVEDLIKGNDSFKDGKTGKQYRDVQEFIAESWEKYHTEGGKGFSSAFQKVLDQISQAFKSVYNSITGKEISPELRQMFDEILGKKAESKPINDIDSKGEITESTYIPNHYENAKRYTDLKEGDVLEVPIHDLMPRLGGELGTADANSKTDGPIDIRVLNSGVLQITDGHNRFKKALLNGDKTVEIKVGKTSGYADVYPNYMERLKERAASEGRVGTEEKEIPTEKEVDHEDPLEVTLQRDALMQRVQDEFFKPENGSRSIGDDVVMNGAIKTLSREAVGAGKSILNHLADKVKGWDNELFNPETGERRIDDNGRFVQKVLTDEELGMLGVHSLELEKKIREAKFQPGVEMDNAALSALLGEQEQLQRLTAAVTEAAGRGFRFIQQIYSFGDKGEYNLHVKLAEQLVGSKIPLDETEFKNFKEGLPKNQQKMAQVAHDAITALKAKYDEIEKKRDKVQKNKAKIDAEEINKQTTAGVNQSNTSDVEDGDKTKNTTKSGKIKKSSAGKVSDALDKLADLIENKNLLGGNLPEGTQSMGPTGGQNFSKAVADSIRRIAQKIRKLEGKIPDLIDDEVKLLIKDGHDEKQAREAIKNQLKQAGIEDEAINATPKRDDLINKIVEHSKNAKTPNKLSKESVKKNLVKQLAVEVALRGEPVESVPEKVIKLLKEKGIELDRNQYNDAFLRQGEFKLSRSNDLETNAKKLSKELTESEKLFTEMEKLDEQIASVQDTGSIDKDKKNIPEKVTIPKLAEKESQLKEAMIKKGIKFERGSKDSQAAKRGVLDAHNEAVGRFGDKLTKLLDDNKFGDKGVEGLKDFLRGLQKKLTQKVDATNLDTHIKEASLKVEKAINEFNRDWFTADKRGNENMQEVLNDLNRLHRDIESNTKKSAEKIALDRYKKRMISDIDEYNRKKNAGEFDNAKGYTEFKKDAEAYSLSTDKEKIKLEFMRAMDEAKYQQAKHSAWGKAFLFARGVRSVTGRMIVSGLGNIQAKLIGSATTRKVTPLSRALGFMYKKVLGLEGSVVQESNNSKAMWRGYRETIIGSSEKKAMAAVEEGQKNVYETNDKLIKAQDAYRNLIESGDKEAASKFRDTELAKAQNEFDKAAMVDATNFMYSKMHTNPWRGRLYIFEKGLSKQEEGTGMFGKRETIGDIIGDNSPVDFGDDTNKFNAAVKKTGSRVSKIIRAGLFYGNMTTRSHSVWKDIPARQAMVEGFMKRLERAQRDGEDISNYEVKARIWHEAVSLEGQEAKFQGKNKAVDVIRDIQSSVGKGILKAGGNEYAAKTVDELAYMTTQVLKVPMNIAKTKVFQYQLGAIIGTFDALAHYSKAKKAGLGFSEYMKTIDPKYSDRIISALSKGTLGLASSILVGVMTMNGQYVSGGTYPDPKKKNVPTVDGPQDLEYGDLVILGHKLPHAVAVGWGHTLLGYTMEMGNFITEEAMKAGEKGETAVESWMDGLLEASKATVSTVPFILPLQRERDYKTGGTTMVFKSPFSSFGYFGAVKDIEAGYQNYIQSPEDKKQYAKPYQMSTMEGIMWRSGMLWGVPSQDEAQQRKEMEKAEKENRAEEFKSKNPDW